VEGPGRPEFTCALSPESELFSLPVSLGFFFPDQQGGFLPTLPTRRSALHVQIQNKQTNRQTNRWASKMAQEVNVSSVLSLTSGINLVEGKNQFLPASL